MKTIIYSFAVIIISFAIGINVVKADITVVGSTGAGWQDFPATLDADQSPYWDGTSADVFSDGTNGNIGFFLTKSGGLKTSRVSPNLNPRSLQYWGFADGSADPNVTIMPGTFDATLVAEFSDSHYYTSFGIYNSNATDTYAVIFPGNVYSPNTRRFTSVEQFGLGLSNWFGFQGTQVAVSDSAIAEFAIFRDPKKPETIWVGAQDGGGVDTDFQDQIEKLTEVTPRTHTNNGNN